MLNNFYSFISQALSIKTGIKLIALLFFLSALVQAQDVITVLDLESDGSVSKNTIESICNKINSDLSYDKRYTPIDRQYLPFMLNNIEFKKPKHCTDAQCLSKIGKEIGSKYIIGGSVRIKKKKVSITLNLVDVESEKTIKSILSKYPMDKDEFINTQIPEMVQSLINPEIASPPVPVAQKKRSKKHPAAWITTSTLVAGAAAAIVYIFYFKQPAEDENLSISDIPVHIIGQ